MKTTTKQKRPEHKKRIKMMLLAGKVLTKRGLDRMLDCTNSAECINQLRKEGMEISTTWKKSKNGIRYGEYRYIPAKKVDRIKSREYLNQAYPKGLTRN